MAIPKAVHVDFLDVSTLRGPLLDSYYGSAAQKDDVGEIAREIMRRYLAKVPRDTGNLAATAKVTFHRSKEHKDKRWESEFSVGGPRAPYVVPLEAEKHYLDDVLREMGFFVGDRVDGPEGTIARPHRKPPDRRPVYQMTEVEQRKERARAQREYAAAAYDPEVEARREANLAAEMAQDRLDAMQALRSSRVGSKASEQKFNMADLHRFADSIEGEDTSELDSALAEHNEARRTAGLDPLRKRGDK